MTKTHNYITTYKHRQNIPRYSHKDTYINRRNKKMC